MATTDSKEKFVPFFISKEKKEQANTPAQQRPAPAPARASHSKDVQIVHRDRGLAISKFLEQIQTGVNQINANQNNLVIKDEIGSADGLEIAHMDYVERNINRLNPVTSLNILCEISHKFKDGSFRSDDFKLLTERVMGLYADCRSLSLLDEHVKFKPKKRQLIRKMTTLLNKWEKQHDKKILDEIGALKADDNVAVEDFNVISSNYINGKDVLESLKAFCGFRLDEVVEPPVLKNKPHHSPTVIDFLEGIYRELLEVKYSFAQLENNACQTQDIVAIGSELKEIKEELAKLSMAKSEQPTQQPQSQKMFKGGRGKRAKDNPDAEAYNEILTEITQLKSELSDEIKHLK